MVICGGDRYTEHHLRALSVWPPEQSARTRSGSIVDFRGHNGFPLFTLSPTSSTVQIGSLQFHHERVDRILQLAPARWMPRRCRNIPSVAFTLEWLLRLLKEPCRRVEEIRLINIVVTFNIWYVGLNLCAVPKSKKRRKWTLA